MKVKDLKQLYGQEFNKLLTGEYDDFDVIVQINDPLTVGALHMFHADEKQKKVWFSGNPKIMK